MLSLVTGLTVGAMGAQSGSVGKEEGSVSLFNGRDLTGWHIMGEVARAFYVNEGELRCRGGQANYPIWLRSDKVYENFVLRFEYKMGYYTESGLFIHAPMHGRCSTTGIKIVVTEDTARGAKTQHTGTILGVKRELAIAADKHSTWNSCEVFMDYPTLRVTVNGQKVQEIDCSKNDKLRRRMRRGHIGIQAMGSIASYRNIRIKELPAKEKWVPLFNGKDLTGWTILGKTVKWEVHEGVLRATGNGYLITDAKYQDFELFTYVRTTPHANGGIFFRWKGLNTRDRGYEIQIYNNPDGNNPTGSVYAKIRNHNLNARDGEWFPMHIFVNGKTVFTRINGEDGASCDQLELVRPGRISLQMHRHGARIEFKDLRIKPLD
jgi:hypothetical protein